MSPVTINLVIKWLGIITLMLLGITGYVVFFLTPAEAYQGIAQKIMYIHVPSVFVAYISLLCCFLCSVAFLRKKRELFDKLALSSAEIGVLFMGICLLTGAVWGKPTWNTYWTWDARLTVSLIVFLIFSGYCLFRKFSGYGKKQATMASALAIVGFFSVPINHMAVTWWRTLHQPSTIFSRRETMAPEFKIALWWSFAAFFFLFLYLLLSRFVYERDKREELKHLANVVNT